MKKKSKKKLFLIFWFQNFIFQKQNSREKYSIISGDHEILVLTHNFQSLVHPCDEENNGGCSQICNKRMEKHECSCEGGFVLEEDKTTCKKGNLNYVP